MKAISNRRHERFAQLLAGGSSQAAAYREVYPAARKWAAETVHKRASELARNGEVLGRVKELTKAGADEAIMTRQEALKRLSEIARKERGMLVVAAVREIGKLSDWYAPEKQAEQDPSQPPRGIIYLPMPILAPRGDVDDGSTAHNTPPSAERAEYEPVAPSDTGYPFRPPSVSPAMPAKASFKF